MKRLGHTVVAIPVRNEADLIEGCINTLMAQSNDFDTLLLLLNNCTDATLRICQDAALSSGKIQIIETWLDGDLASAGEARRIALDHALVLSGDGVILTTDADTVPCENWVVANLCEIAHGADVVCGMATLFPEDEDRIPENLRKDDFEETLLLNILDEIAFLVDPDPADPWPRHQQHSGASIAMRAATLRQAGGPPHVASGEDRILLDRLQLIDARIRHSPEITVQVSGRLEGRAAGGMAETIARRVRQQDELTDEMVEPAVDAFRRASSKAHLRKILRNNALPAKLADNLLIPAAAMQSILAVPYFGAAWAEIERLSPVLRRRRVAYTDLNREIRHAQALLSQLRKEAENTAMLQNRTPLLGQKIAS